MLNQYSYTEQEGVNSGLFYAPGSWNNEMSEQKIKLNGGMLWGWDATASNQSVMATVATDTASESNATQYNFEAAIYRAFENDLSNLQIQANQNLFIKIGVKIFDNSHEDDSVLLANGISNYF